MNMYTKFIFSFGVLFFSHTLFAQMLEPVSVLHTQPYIYTVNPNGNIYVNYRFKATMPTHHSNHVFVHFLDSNGRIAFQDDHLPPTSSTQWYGDITYERSLKIPTHIVPGHYKIAIGLYNTQNGSRTEMKTLNSEEQPSYTFDANHKSYIVGELYITNKQIVEANFNCNHNDVTQPLSQAFKSIKANQVLKLPFGTCYYNSINNINVMRLDNKTDIEVVGHGAPSTQLIAKNKMRSGVIISGSNNVLLRDFKIKTDRLPGLTERTGDPNAIGIYVENSTNVQLNQMAISSSLGPGIAFYRSQDAEVTRNFVKNSAADGIHLTGLASNIKVIDNQTLDTGDDGVSSIGYLTGLYSGFNDNILIENNKIRYKNVKWGSGIAIEGTINSKVLNNYIEKSGASGIRIGSISGYSNLDGQSHQFVTGGVRNIEVAGNELLNVKTRQELGHGAIHLVAMPANTEHVNIYNNIITNNSSVGTARDAISMVGNSFQNHNYYVQNINIYQNKIHNLEAGILGDWCVSLYTPNFVNNIVINKNLLQQPAPNVYNNLKTCTFLNYTK